MRTLRTALLFTNILVLACSSKGYSGPELDSSLVSNIAVHANTSVDVQRINIDNNNLGTFSSSIDVLEGGHSFIIDYEMESTKTCYPEQGICQVIVSIGQCQGEVKTLKGRNYLISLTNKNSILTTTILPKGYYDFNVRQDETNIGSVSCSENYTRSIIKSDRS